MLKTQPDGAITHVQLIETKRIWTGVRCQFYGTTLPRMRLKIDICNALSQHKQEDLYRRRQLTLQVDT